MQVYYRGCLCTYSTYRVIAEEKPVFYLNECPPGANVFDLGFIEVQYGLWCHFLNDEELAKMEEYMRKGDRYCKI